MKTSILPLLLISFIGFTLFCCRQTGESATSYLNEAKEISLGDSGSGSETSQQQRDDYVEEDKPVPRVSLPPDAQLIQLLEVNLDLDRNDEQILALKDTSSGSSAIRLLIADYDTIRDRYVVTWSGRTKTNSRRSFNISVIDVTGDHNLEILCSGITEEGLQTIDIFRRTTSPDQLGLYFESILSIAVKGTIELLEQRRAQSYQKGQRSGNAYPVLTTTRDERSERLGDIIKATYVWRSGSGSYRRVKTEKIPGQEIEDTHLRELLRGGKENFEAFLHGPWLLTDQSEALSRRHIIHFDEVNETLTLYSGSIQESYVWTNSYRFLADSISISGDNTIVPFMRIYLSVFVEDLSTVRITTYDVNSHNGSRSTNSTWSGTYQKLGPSMQKSFLRLPLNMQENVARPGLTGMYRNDSGMSFFFDPPYFTLHENNETIRGGFSTYTFGTDILDLRILDDNGLVVDRRTYSFDFIEEESETEILRRLVLRPGRVERTGFIPTDSKALIFQQREIIQDEQ
jgi:hypothetical protein